MKDIQKIDTNFYVNNTLSKENVIAYDVCDEPFKIYGLIKPQHENDMFKRMPQSIAQDISEGILVLNKNTAGGRVRFATDSSYIAICAVMGNISKMSHMTLAATAGFDLYRREKDKEQYVHTFIPPYELESNKEYMSEAAFSHTDMYEYTLNFPLYSDVKKLYIILDKEANVRACSNYSNVLPIVYYGSSITQGACASRPGNSYQSIISRRFNYDYINLGFSGSAKGEVNMAQYIAGVKMCMFVYDYDYNAQDVCYLKSTHEPFFKIIRKKQPQLPIICISKPYCKDILDYERKDIIKRTVENARAEGDTNVYFIDSIDFVKELSAGDGITIDGCHPNDLGFQCMANVIGDKIKEIFL